jgi:antitoxin (DNA-binding transcriptional repressor) of toxin-antitoxin stability system
VTEAARHFADLVNRTWYRGETTTLVKGGEPVAVVGPIGGGVMTGRDWVARWVRMPHLGADDAAEFEAGLSAARAKLGAPSSPWD